MCTALHGRGMKVGGGLSLHVSAKPSPLTCFAPPTGGGLVIGSEKTAAPIHFTAPLATHEIKPFQMAEK